MVKQGLNKKFFTERLAECNHIQDDLTHHAHLLLNSGIHECIKHSYNNYVSYAIKYSQFILECFQNGQSVVQHMEWHNDTRTTKQLKTSILSYTKHLIAFADELLIDNSNTQEFDLINQRRSELANVQKEFIVHLNQMAENESSPEFTFQLNKTA